MNIGEIVREVESVPDPVTVPAEPERGEPMLPEPVRLPARHGSDDPGRAA